MKIRLRVKELAEAQGLDMTKLHIRSEVAYNTVRKVFHDPYADITTGTLVRLAEALGVSPAELMEVVPDTEGASDAPAEKKSKKGRRKKAEGGS